MNRRTLAHGAVVTAGGLVLGTGADVFGKEVGKRAERKRSGRVRVQDHVLADAGGPFLGLGVSYFTALHRCKYDRPRLESDLAFLAAQGFNYYRMLSMVGWNGAWQGREIAPITYTSREGKRVETWPDYWQQLGELIDIAYDRYGLRAQITVFADAQLMPGAAARREHLRRIIEDVVPGREQKIILIEVANEAWQNGFPGPEGVAELKQFTRYLAARTAIPVAISSNHVNAFEQLYADSAADVATWHFSRDRRTDEGWHPVYDCWRLGERPGFPPVSSNEPIGPGASVNTETDALRLVMAAAFAYVAKLPMYVFHSEAGVMGKSRFQEPRPLTATRHSSGCCPPISRTGSATTARRRGLPLPCSRAASRTATGRRARSRWKTAVSGTPAAARASALSACQSASAAASPCRRANACASGCTIRSRVTPCAPSPWTRGSG